MVLKMARTRLTVDEIILSVETYLKQIARRTHSDEFNTYSSDLTQDKSFIKQYKYNFIFVFKLELFCISL